jgi:hypothetical protein
MKSYDIVGYVFLAGVHCECCTAAVFPRLRGIDREGNDVTPYTVSDACDSDDATHCDTCHEELYSHD